MKKDGDNEDKFLCAKGEKVTITFTDNQTTFLVACSFEKPKPFDPPNPDPDIDPATQTLVFPFNKKTILNIDYDFNTAGSSYDVTLKGDTGRTFKRTIDSTFNGTHPTRRTYTFSLDS